MTLKKSGLISLFAASSLVLFSASPALAETVVTGAGGGTGIGPEYPIDPAQIPAGSRCITPGLDPLPEIMGTVSGGVFNLDHAGNYTAVNSDQVDPETFIPDSEQAAQTSGTAVVNGPTDMDIVVGNHVESPEGTYKGCFVPGSVPVQNWTVKTPGYDDPFHPEGAVAGGTGVYCVGTSGSYERRAVTQVQFTLHGVCTVKTFISHKHSPHSMHQVTVADRVPTTHVVTGEIHRCDATGSTIDYCDTSKSLLVTTYVAAGAAL